MLYTVGDIASMANDSLGITNIDGRLPFIAVYVKDALSKLPYISAFLQKTEKLVKSGDERGVYDLPRDFFKHHDSNNLNVGYAEITWENQYDNNYIIIDEKRKLARVRGDDNPIMAYWAYITSASGEILIPEPALNVVVQYVIWREAKRLSFGTEYKKYLVLAQEAQKTFDSALLDINATSRLTTAGQRRETRLQQNDVLKRR